MDLNRNRRLTTDGTREQGQTVKYTCIRPSTGSPYPAKVEFNYET